MPEISKIDDSNIGIIQPISIAEIKSRIAIRNKAVEDYQSTINEHLKNMKDLQDLNDSDISLLKKAAELNVADAINSIDVKSESV